MNHQELQRLPSLKEFIKRLSAEIVVTGEPLIFLEFQSARRQYFQSRIAIFDIPSENEVMYRYADKLGVPLKSWRIRVEEYKILQIVHPARKTLQSKENPLAIIQVRK